MTSHSISTRLIDGAHAQVVQVANLWPTLIVWDRAAEFLITLSADMAPDDAVRFANRLAAEATVFAEKTRKEAAARHAAEAKEAA